MAGRTAQLDVAERVQTPDAAVLALTRQFLAELHPGAAWIRPVKLDSSLERDLGLDSLSRVELAVRIEHVRRHAGILSNAETSIVVTVPEARGVAHLLEARVCF